MLEEKSVIMTIENDEQTNQPTPLPLKEKEDAKNFEKNEKGTTCDNEVMIEST